MQIINCRIHDVKFALPNSGEEYLNGRFHEDIEKLCEHHERCKICKFIEVKE